MAILRVAEQKNTTGAVLTSSALKEGRSYKELIIRRVFAAIDVGAGAGKTQHAQGCLVGTLRSGKIHGILDLTIQKGNPVGNFSLNKVTTTGGIKITPDRKSLYIREETAGAVIAANDSLCVKVLIES